MSQQDVLQQYQEIVSQLNSMLSWYNTLLDDNADISALQNVFETGDIDAKPSIPTISDIVNTLAESESINNQVSYDNTVQSLVETFNNTAQASAEKAKQLIQSIKQSASSITKVATTPKTIPSIVYDMAHALAIEVIDAIYSWLENAELTQIDARLPSLITLADKLINILGTYKSGEQSESAQ